MKVAIIGAGAIARVHARALREVSGVELAAVCDLSPGLARCFAEQFDVSRSYTNHIQLLEETEPDCVFITTPVGSHATLATDALQAGAHVLVEKPITSNMEQWHSLRKLSESAGRMLVEDQNYRFNSPVMRLRELLQSGAFGEIVHLDMLYCLPIHGKGSPFADTSLPNPILKMAGGAILDFLPHMTYIANEFLGSHLNVQTLWLKRDKSTILPHDEFRALIECERGTASMAFSSHAQPSGCWLRIAGTKMFGRANLFEGTLSLDKVGVKVGPMTYLKNGFRESIGASWGACRSLSSKLADRPMGYEGLRELDRRFCNAVMRGEAAPVTLEQVEASNRLIHDLTRERFPK